MIYLTAILSLLGAASCIVDAGLIVTKSRLYSEMGWGLPSPFSFCCIALACLLLSRCTMSPERRPAGKTMRILLVLGALLLAADQLVAMGDVLAPVLWTAFGAILGVLLLGFALLCSGISLLRAGCGTTPGTMLSTARISLLVGSIGTVLLNLLAIFGVALSYAVSAYVLPGFILLMSIGIIALALSMKKKKYIE